MGHSTGMIIGWIMTLTPLLFLHMYYYNVMYGWSSPATSYLMKRIFVLSFSIIVGMGTFFVDSGYEGTQLCFFDW